MLTALKSLFTPAPAPTFGRVCRWCKGAIALQRATHPVPLCDGCWSKAHVGTNWVRLSEELPEEFTRWAARLLNGYSVQDARNDAEQAASEQMAEVLKMHKRAAELISQRRYAEGRELDQRAILLRNEAQRLLTSLRQEAA